METLETALQALQKHQSSKSGMSNVANSLLSLASVSDILKNPVLSDAVCKKLSFILRKHMIHLYQVALKPALQYAAAVFAAISEIKLNLNDECRASWEDMQESLLSGILDFLEQHLTTNNQALIASVFYPPLCREFFPQEDIPILKAKDNLLCTIFQLLSETVISHPGNQHRLRNSDVLGGKRLGLMLAQCKDFLVIEALLELFGNIIPSAKVPERRTQFIHDVFSPARLKCSAKLLEDATPTAWDMVSSSICDALARSNIEYPQPFETNQIQTGTVSYSVNRIYIDKSAFMASVDEGGKLETFKVPFSTVQQVKISASSESTATAVVVAGAPPLLGHAFFTQKDGEIPIAFDLKKGKVSDFVTVLRQRGLQNVIEPIHRKLSKVETDVDLDFQSTIAKFPPFEEKIENLSRLWQSQWSPNESDHNGTTSPLHKAKAEGREKGVEIGSLPIGFGGAQIPSSTSIGKQDLDRTSVWKEDQGELFECLTKHARRSEAATRAMCSYSNAPCNEGENIMPKWTSTTQTQRDVLSLISAETSKKRQLNAMNHVDLTLTQRLAVSCPADAATVVDVSLDTGLKSPPRRRGIGARIVSAETEAKNMGLEALAIGRPVASSTEHVGQVSCAKRSSTHPISSPLANDKKVEKSASQSVCKEELSLESAKGDLERGKINKDEHEPDDAEDNVQLRCKMKTKELCAPCPAPSSCQQRDEFNPTSILVSHAKITNNFWPSVRVYEPMASEEQDCLAKQRAQSGSPQTRWQNIGKLHSFIVTEDRTATNHTAKFLLEGASDMVMTGSKVAGNGLTLGRKSHASLEHAEEKIQLPIRTFTRECPEWVRTGQCEGTKISEPLLLGETNPASRGRPSVSFALPRESNPNGRLSSGIARPSNTYESLRKRSRNEKHIRELHTGRSIASDEASCKRRRLNADAGMRIIEVVNQIHEIVANNIVKRFDGVRRDIYATQASILEGIGGDLLTMHAKSIEHYEQLADLANEYTMHRLKIIRALSRLLDVELNVINGIKGILHHHDRLSLSSKFPDALPPAVPDSFRVTCED